MPTVRHRIELPALHPGQRQIRQAARRFNVAACGRRFGKTTLGITLLVETLLQGRPAGWFSPSYKFLADTWRQMKLVLAEVIRQKSEAEHRIELITGGTLDMWSLDDPGAGRGRRYQRVIIDEAARVRHLDDAWNGSIRPTLTDLQGDAWFFSTPRGRNYFWQLFALGQDAAWPDWISWQLPTSANPYIAPVEIAAAEQQLPARIFAQEYLATFLDDGGGIFRNVRAAATATPQERAFPGHAYIFGVDWGKYEDFTVLTVLDVTSRAVAMFDRFHQIDYTLQMQRLQALAERFPPQAIIAERNAMGEPLIEHLQRQGWPVVPFTTTHASKTLLIDLLALTLEQGTLRLLPDPALLAELEAYEAERLPGGTLRYGAPEGMHDDCVMSLALAVWGMDGHGRVEYAPGLWT